MKDPWDKAYVYGRKVDIYHHLTHGKIAHIVVYGAYVDDTLCGMAVGHFNLSPKPYPVCKNCLRTKRAKELGL